MRPYIGFGKGLKTPVVISGGKLSYIPINSLSENDISPKFCF